jgi:predicted alpha/beta hydrolase family esterase
MPPVIVVPGLGGSEDDHWQTHLERSFTGAIRVHQDDWNRPDLSRWLARLEECVEARPGSILVAHSLGCILVAHLADRRPDLSVAAAVLVAPADVEACRDTLRTTRSFAPIPRRELPFHAVVVVSTNDPFMGCDRAFDLTRSWRAQFINAGAKGHINVASGFGRWRAGEDIVRSLAGGTNASDLRVERSTSLVLD